MVSSRELEARARTETVFQLQWKCVTWVPEWQFKGLRNNAVPFALSPGLAVHLFCFVVSSDAPYPLRTCSHTGVEHFNFVVNA